MKQEAIESRLRTMRNDPVELEVDLILQTPKAQSGMKLAISESIDWSGAISLDEPLNMRLTISEVEPYQQTYNDMIDLMALHW